MRLGLESRPGPKPDVGQNPLTKSFETFESFDIGLLNKMNKILKQTLNKIL